MRDYQRINLNNESIIITTDNSGGIGTKKHDFLNVDYETLGYFCARTALMENISAGAEPFSISLLNFCGDDAWDSLSIGISKACDELKLEPSLIGSSESNFEMVQSAFGLSVFGRDLKKHQQVGQLFAVIGKPLVGEEVLSMQDEMISLNEFKTLVESDLAEFIIPVGSKGIQSELDEYGLFDSYLDLQKSSGPSTCVVISYDKENMDKLESMFQHKFHKLKKRANS